MRQQIITSDLCARLPYGPWCKWDEEKYRFRITGICPSELEENKIIVIDSAYDEYYFDEIKPILFPSLTEPITVAGYNDGKPFIPLIEIAKLCAKEDFAEKKDFGIRLTDNTVSYKYQDVIYEFSFYGHRFNYTYKWKEWSTGCVNQRLGFDLLNQWHVNYRLLPGEFVLATNEYA